MIRDTTTTIMQMILHIKITSKYPVILHLKTEPNAIFDLKEIIIHLFSVMDSTNKIIQNSSLWQNKKMSLDSLTDFFFHLTDLESHFQLP